MPVIIVSPDFTGDVRGSSQGVATATAVGNYAASGIGSSAGVAAPYGTTFDPTTISGLKLWVAARFFTDKQDSDQVATWADKSGQGNDLTQSTAGARPLYKQNIIGGKPALLFDAVNDFLTIPNFLSGFTAGEIFIVVKRRVETPASSAVSGFWEFGTSSFATNWPFTDNNVYDDWGTTVRKSTGNPTPLLADPNVYNVSSASGAWTSRFNGTQHFTTGSNTVGFTTTPSLGRSQVTGLDIFFDGWFAEALIFDNVLSGGDRTTVTDALKAIYGIV